MAEIANVEKIIKKDGSTQYKWTYDDGRVGVGSIDPQKANTAYGLQKSTGSGKSQAEIRDMLNQYGYKQVKNRLELEQTAYNPKSDYQSMINYALSQGNKQAAAWYESQRNKKLADMDAAGTNTQGYQPTSLYGAYYDPDMNAGYAKYLEKSYAKAPATYTDETIGAGAQALADMEEAGDYEGANRLREQWLYRKNYDTGEFEQLAQPDWRGLTQEQWKAMNGDYGSEARSAAIRQLGVYGGNGGTMGDYGQDLPSYADLSKGQTVTYTGKDGSTALGYMPAGGSYLDSMLGQLQELYQSSLENNNTAYAAQLKQAMAALERQRESVDEQYQDAQKQLYIDMMIQKKQAPQQLSAMGYNGGLTESSLLGIDRDYEQNMLANEEAKNQALADLTYQEIAAQSDNAVAKAQAQQTAQENYLSNYMSILAQLQEQANYERELALSAQSDAQTQAQNALAYLQKAGITPTAAQLMAAYGLSEEQAAAYLNQQSQTPVYQTAYQNEGTAETAATGSGTEPTLPYETLKQAIIGNVAKGTRDLIGPLLQMYGQNLTAAQNAELLGIINGG